MKELLNGLQKKSFIAGAAGLGLSALGFFMNRQAFLEAYLGSYLFWAGLALGCFAILLLHQLSGGAWGVVIRPTLEAGSSLVIVAMALFLPILFHLKQLYPWAGSREVAEEIMRQKIFYLNPQGFILRFVIYFIVWIVTNRVMLYLSRPGASESSIRTSKFVSGIGLLLYVILMTLASVDWAMSLTPEWFSTVYGLHFIVGQGLSAFAFSVMMLSLLSEKGGFQGVTANHFHDLGNLLLAFVMLWAYLTLSQFLITWSANLPEEITWYMDRSKGGWQTLGTGLVLAHFALPFFLLLARKNKRRGATLAKIAFWIFIMRYLDILWYLGPAFHPGKIVIHWLHITLWIGLGGLWLGIFSGLLQKVRFPELPAAVQHGHH